MDLIIGKSKSDVNLPSNAVATAWRKPSIDEKSEMAGFFRSLSQRFRSQSTRQPRSNLNARGEGPDPIRNKQKNTPAPKIDQRRECLCKVLLLDGTDVNIIVSKKAFGQEVYEHVFNLLDVDERDYFGLQFTDHYHVQHWLDPVKKLAKQVPIGPPYTFRFSIKFYSSEPMNLREELTRYQFFLQLKQDVQSGKLLCPKDVAVDLAAYALQSEFGDQNNREHDVVFVSEFRFHPEQDEEMESAILDAYKKCKGQTPATAEMNYLNRVKWLEFYGVDMHIVEGKDGNEYKLGLTPTGMLVFDGAQKIGLFFWEKIQRLDFRNRKLTLVVEEDADHSITGQIQLHTFVFELSSHKACKHLWKCAIEHHTFFRLKFHRAPKQNRPQLFRLGSTFKYRGRTEYENVHRDNKLSRRSGSTFERRPSQRYVPRQSYLQKQKFRQEMRQQAILANSLTANNQSKDTSKIIASPMNQPTNSTVLSPETRLDNLIAGQNTNISQLNSSPNGPRRTQGNDKILLPPGSTAPSSTVIGLQKPSVPGNPSTFAASSGSHVTTIEINEKGANVYNGAKSLSSQPAMPLQFFGQASSRINSCQSDLRADNRATFIPIMQTGRPTMSQSRLVTEL
ncbi:hypothetical protein FO519_002547 [Halicephalobus sp. NKZ332]|nr:hypothetical protein FO519_002547 [Halicephalobus sp. NKZ332]